VPNHTPGAQTGTFAKNGEFWTIAYSDDSFSLKDVKGLTYLRRLLQHPGEELHAIDLVHGSGTAVFTDCSAAEAASVASGLSIGGLGDAGAMLDAQAKRECRQRLDELRADLAELRKCGDVVRGEQVEAEIDFIERELLRAVGLGGRDRRGGSAAERARLNVTGAIKSALQKIVEHHGALGKLLESSIKTGLFSVYTPRPANEIAWRFSLDETEPAPDRPVPTRIALRFASARSDSIVPPTTFVGREAESAILRRYLDQARQGTGSVVLISGTAGIGKTRIAHELAGEAILSDMVTFEGNCYDREDPMPFAPFVEILESALERASSREDFRALLSSDAAEISRLLPQLRRFFSDIPAPMELAPAQSQRMLFNAVGNLLARIAADGVILLLLEDLHWADTGSLAIFAHLARMVARFPVLMLRTYRSNELVAGSSLAKTLRELIRLQLIDQVSLHGLSQDAVAAIIRALGKREPTPALSAQLHHITDGNSFFVGERTARARFGVVAIEGRTALNSTGRQFRRG
jgi:hypothetical protein